MEFPMANGTSVGGLIIMGVGAIWLLGKILGGGASQKSGPSNPGGPKPQGPSGGPISGGAPHGYRASVAGLAADAKKLGTLHVRGDGYEPKVGDLILGGRSGENPLNGGHGHVERVSALGTSPRYPTTIGGNENDTWVEATYDLEDPKRVAIIEVPADIGERAVEFARAELHAGHHEIPGNQADPRISEYLSLCRVGGGPQAGMPGHENEGTNALGAHPSDEIPWCASAASWCCYQAMGGVA